MWRLRAPLLIALQRALGTPVDSYANGSQTWLVGDGPGGVPVEWRLHPRPGFARPGRITDYHLFPLVAGALSRDEEPEVDPHEAWTGLEASPAYDDPVEVTELVAWCTTALGVEPDASGLVDRVGIGRAWERSGGDLDVVAHLCDLLDPA